MAKIRVGQLAKELNLKVSEVLARLRELGAEVKSNLSTVEEELAGQMRSNLGARGPTPAAVPDAGDKSTAKATPHKPATGHGGQAAAVPSPKGAPTLPRVTSQAQTARGPVVKTPAATAKSTPRPAVPGSAQRPAIPARTFPAASTTRLPGSPAASPTTPHPGAVRPAPAGAPKPVTPSTPQRPQIPGGPPRPGLVRGPNPPQHRAPSPIATTNRPSGAPAGPTGLKPTPSPVRPLGGASQPQRPLPPRGASAHPSGSPPRQGYTAPPLRPVGRGETAKRSTSPSTLAAAPATAQASRPQAVPPPAARAAAQPPPIPEVLQEITITEGVTVKELSEKMDRKAKDIITKLLGRGIMATINQPLDINVAREVCRELGFDAKVITFEEEVSLEQGREAVPGDLRPRDPVVTIMGHVDHGKTSLLDAIRESNIAAGEAGGITQHIGAYHIRRKARGVTFIDTPGHEAFTLMRARGARVTDIVVLVVAADDGVMPQTIEAMHHARAAGVPMVVAINKIDKPGANLDRVKKQLSDQGLLVEDWGGDVVAVAISAKQRTGIDDLLEMILLVADILDLKADPASLASGVVLESRLDRSRGPVATVLVQRGTLKIGDPFIAGAIHGKVRAMFDDLGHRAREAGPSIPVEVLGLEGVPEAGNPFQVLEDEWKVRQIGAFRQQKLRQEAMAKSSRLTLDHLYQQIKEGVVKELPLVVKADVQGSVEALSKSLTDLPSEKVKIKIIHSGSGAITETDVHLASASNAIIIGYNVRPERSAQELADKEKVDLRLHSVIYDITNEIKNAMLGLLEPESKEVYQGRAEVRQVFKVPKVGTIAGSHVSDGKIARSAEVRLLRDNVVVYTGKVSSLKRFKDDASEVKAGYECGIGLANFNDVKVGDVIEAFKIEKIAVKDL
jgi:translation initiation factor IF-2